jgi:hypothetical protein
MLIEPALHCIENVLVFPSGDPSLLAGGSFTESFLVEERDDDVGSICGLTSFCEEFAIDFFSDKQHGGLHPISDRAAIKQPRQPVGLLPRPATGFFSSAPMASTSESDMGEQSEILTDTYGKRTGNRSE